MKSFKYLLALTLTVLAQTSHASAELPASCLDLDDLDDQMISCGSNSLAPKSAQACYRDIQKQWKAASARLSVSLKTIGTGNRQNEFEAKTQSGLIATVAEVDALIVSMKAKADMVADYELLMVNDPNAESLEDSLSCFGEPFQELGKVIDQMDQAVIDARAARAKAVELALAAGMKQSNFAKVAGQKEAPKARKPNSAHDHFGPGEKPGESDISGLPGEGNHSSAPRPEGRSVYVSKSDHSDDAITGSMFGGKLTGFRP